MRPLARAPTPPLLLRPMDDDDDTTTTTATSANQINNSNNNNNQSLAQVQRALSAVLPHHLPVSSTPVAVSPVSPQLNHLNMNHLNMNMNLNNISTMNPNPVDVGAIVGAYGSLAAQHQSQLLFNLLRHSSAASLQFVASIVLPALRRDFLADLPAELVHLILRHLDIVSLGRAASVSKRWRSVVDGDAACWRALIVRNGWRLRMERDLLSALALLPANNHTKHTNNHSNHTNNYTQNNHTSHCHQKGNGDGSNEVRWIFKNNRPYPILVDTASTPKRARLLQQIHSSFATAAPPPLAIRTAVGASNGPSSTSVPTIVMPASAKATPTRPRPRPQKFIHPPLQPSCTHVYKHLLHRYVLLRRNWFAGHANAVAFPAHGSNVVTSLHLDQDKLISGSDDNSIHVYKIQTGYLHQRLTGHEGGVWCLSVIGGLPFSQNGKPPPPPQRPDDMRPGHVVVSGSTDRTVRIWDLNLIEANVGPSCLYVLRSHLSTIRCLSVVPCLDPNCYRGVPVKDGWQVYWLVSGSRDATLNIWTITVPPLHIVKEYIAAEKAKKPTSSSRRSLNTLNNTFHPVQAAQMPLHHLIPGNLAQPPANGAVPPHAAIGVGGVPSETASAAGDNEEPIETDEISSLPPDHPYARFKPVLKFTLTGHSESVRAIAVGGCHVVSGSYDSSVRLWNMKTGRCERVLQGHSARVYAVSFDPVTMKVMSSGLDNNIRVWDGNTGECVHVLTGHTALVGLLEYSQLPYPITPVTSHPEYQQQIRQTYSVGPATPHPTARTPGGEPFHTPRHRLPSRGTPNRPILHRPSNLSVSNSPVVLPLSSTSRPPPSPISRSSISPPAQHPLLVSAAADQSLRFWDPHSGTHLYALHSHPAAITCFTMDSDKIVSGSEGALKLWDPRRCAFVRDLVTGIQCAWRVVLDDERCVCAVQRDNLTWIEMLDFDIAGDDVGDVYAEDPGFYEDKKDGNNSSDDNDDDEDGDGGDKEEKKNVSIVVTSVNGIGNERDEDDEGRKKRRRGEGGPENGHVLQSQRPTFTTSTGSQSHLQNQLTRTNEPSTSANATARQSESDTVIANQSQETRSSPVRGVRASQRLQRAKK